MAAGEGDQEGFVASLEAAREKLLVRLAEARASVRQAEAAIAATDGLIARYRGTAPPQLPSPRARGNPARIARAAERVIARAKRPLSRGEIARALPGEGVDVASVDLPKYVGVVLSQRPQVFELVRGRGFALRAGRDGGTPTGA